MVSTVAVFLCAAFAVFSGAAAQTTYLPDSQNVYHLFTRQNPSVSQPMVLGFPTLIGSNFNPARRTVLIVHGWDSDAVSAFNTALVPAILSAADVNLIALDWSAGARTTDQNVLISHNVPLCANSAARFIVWLSQQTGATIDQYHIIGFEVGAHLSGIIGRYLDGQVPFITALAPTRHGFNSTNQFFPTDGGYTEAIHTDVYGSGVHEPVAMSDFYPNNGFFQPGCELVDWECSRDRAFLYFAESVASGGFTAARCEGDFDHDVILPINCDPKETLPMGGLTDKTGNFGFYSLPVNAQSPFSQG
ncbi:lipase member I-like [Leguminivora glycinivorella]|uniref:lipase member I-like n=1 Tax=Leguminivora glycinivorella TaxID=1035111 RepID=UPI00200EB235|nr:lipase member I-like [Leguminivora glycinivorella]